MVKPKYDDDEDVLAVVWKRFSLFFIFEVIPIESLNSKTFMMIFNTVIDYVEI